jgi:hypothetical protein
VIWKHVWVFLIDDIEIIWRTDEHLRHTKGMVAAAFQWMQGARDAGSAVMPNSRQNVVVASYVGSATTEKNVVSATPRRCGT